MKDKRDNRVSIKRELFDRAKRQAEIQGVTITAYVVSAVQERVNDDEVEEEAESSFVEEDEDEDDLSFVEEDEDEDDLSDDEAESAFQSAFEDDDDEDDSASVDFVEAYEGTEEGT